MGFNKAYHVQKLQMVSPQLFHLTNNTLTLAKLFDTMTDNRGSCTTMYDEIPAMYDQIEGGGKCNRRIFLSLNGGNTWSRSTKKGKHHSSDYTHFNYSGKLDFTAISLTKAVL